MSAADAKWALLLSVRVTGSNPTGATSAQRACTQGEVKRFGMKAIKAAIKKKKKKRLDLKAKQKKGKE